MSMSLDEQMALLFVEEATDLLGDFEQALLLLESLPDDPELIGRVFRCAHTLKGNSKILGFERVATFTHELENMLDRLRKGELVLTQGVADTLLAALDVLKALVAEVAGGAAHDPRAYDAASVRMQALVADIQADLEPPPPPPPPLRFSLPEPTQEPPARRSEPERHAAPASAAPASPVAVASARPEPHTGSRPRPVSIRSRAPHAEPPSPTKGREEPPVQAVPAKERKPAGGDGESNSVRVPIDKLDRLINLTGEVVIAHSMIAQLVTDLTPERIGTLQEIVAQMDRHCRELQERMLGARMVPIKNVFSRFHRIVRDLAASTGKAIALELSGEETELDKSVIEKIVDPLTHLVRNAIDHGVESREERRAAGKPEQARVQLSAYQKSGNIFIDVSDDGRGLNRQRILDKGIRSGLVRPGDELSDDEVHALIFHAGFSTAEQVTEISGRGVGMDVVKRNVEALKGSIAILTTPGRGTCFRIKLPLTMAILDGLGLRVGDQVYLVPLVSVVESLQPKAGDIYEAANLAEVVEVRGEYLPLVRLYQLFGVPPTYEAVHEGLVMVVDDGTQKIALQIDELIGQFQVVIKSLEANFQPVPGIAGATILGDGQVALIIDTANIVSLARGKTKLPAGRRSSGDASPLAGSAA